MKTACVFSLCLFPPAYMLERVKKSDTIFIVSDKILDRKNHANSCMIRTALDRMWTLSIPVVAQGFPADETRVDNTLTWHDKMNKDVLRAYSGLKYAEIAREYVKHCFDGVEGDNLVDWLLFSFYELLKLVKWDGKEMYRGDSLQRRRYQNESEFLLNLCLEAQVDRLIVGRSQKFNLNQRLFQRNEIDLELQNWYGSNSVNARDSAIDIIARYGGHDIGALL